jgi:hypothetical protein
MLPSSTLKLSASALALSRLYQHFREREFPTAYKILCVRLPHTIVRGLPHSAMGPTLDTGGSLALTRPGLSPGKRRQASIGAITFRTRRRAPLPMNPQIITMPVARARPLAEGLGFVWRLLDRELNKLSPELPNPGIYRGIGRKKALCMGMVFWMDSHSCYRRSNRKWVSPRRMVSPPRSCAVRM